MSANGFTKMSIYGMNMDLFSSSPIVILKVEDENRYLPIWIGQAEARSILFKLQNQEFVRPLTHDLALSLVNELGGSMERITVTELRDSTFFATIRLEIEGKTVEVDSRPSDAIALAIRSGAEIFASDEVIEEAGVVFEEAMEDTPEDEVVDKFKDWMNQVSPRISSSGPSGRGFNDEGYECGIQELSGELPDPPNTVSNRSWIALFQASAATSPRGWLSARRTCPEPHWSTASPSIRPSCAPLPDAPSESPSARYSGYARRNASTESTSQPTMTSIASPSKRVRIRASLLTLRRTYSQDVSPDLRSSLSV